MGYNTTPLVLRSGVRPTWLPDERFWYRVTTAEGAEFVLVDPVKGTRAPAFDHAKLAAALSAATGRTYAAGNLPFQEIEFSADGQSVTVQAGGRWKCDVKGAKCVAEEGVGDRCRTRWTGRARRPWGSRRSGGGSVPGQEARRLHPRFESVGARCRHQSRRRRSPPTASRTSGTPPTTRAGPAAIGPSYCGRPIPNASPPSSRISAAWAKCTWWRPKWATPHCRRGSTRCRATKWSPRSSASPSIWMARAWCA